MAFVVPPRDSENGTDKGVLPPSNGHAEVADEGPAPAAALHNGGSETAGAAAPSRFVGLARRSLIKSVAKILKGAAPLLAVSVLLFNTMVPILPSSDLVWKLTATRLLFLFGTAAVLASGARLRHFRSPLDVPIAVLIVASGVSMVHRISGNGAALASLLSALALYYLTLAILRLEPHAAWTLAIVALVAVAITSGVAIYQMVHHVETGFCRRYLTDVTCGPGTLMRATGTFANPNVMAAGILLLTPLAAFVPSRIACRPGRLLLALIVVIGCAGLVLTFSDAAWVGAVAGVAALGLTKLYRAGRWHRIYTWGLAGLGAVGVAGVVTGIVGRHGQRNEIWSRAFEIARHHLLTGVGLGQSRAVLGEAQGVVIYHAHDLWLNWLLVAGVLGLVAIAAVTFVSLRQVVGFAMTGSLLGRACMVALVAFYVDGLFDDPSYLQRIALVWWLVMAIAMYRDRHRPAIGMARSRRDKEPVARPEPTT